jgi:hypothetical protein
MYCTVVTICTAIGHCMYRTVVTVCTAQWSLYVPHSGHYMYRTVVTICIARFNIHKFYVLSTQLYLCVLCGSQNKQRLFPYTALTGWFVEPRRCVFTARYGLGLQTGVSLISVFQKLRHSKLCCRPTGFVSPLLTFVTATFHFHTVLIHF